MRTFMKKVYLALIAIITVSCQESNKAIPCKLIYYGTYNKVYEISFNGIDSIETRCGHVDFKLESPYKDKYGHTDKKKFFGSKDFIITPIYLHRSKKMNQEQASSLIAILNRLNSKITTDTLMGDLKMFGISIFPLKSKKIFREAVDYKDYNLKMLVDSLIEYSPIFINDYSHNWFGLENELEMTRMFDHRRNK